MVFDYIFKYFDFEIIEDLDCLIKLYQVNKKLSERLQRYLENKIKILLTLKITKPTFRFGISKSILIDYPTDHIQKIFLDERLKTPEGKMVLFGNFGGNYYNKKYKDTSRKYTINTQETENIYLINNGRGFRHR